MAGSEIIVKDEVRPCMVRKKRALFHKWMFWDDRGYGIVEFIDGRVARVRPEKIRFLDTESIIHNYYWEYWNE